MADAPSPRSLDFFCGVWKRCLHRRSLVTQVPVEGAHTGFVVVDRAPEDMTAVETGSRRRSAGLKHRWSFGKSVETVRLGYTVETVHAHAHAHSRGGVIGSPAGGIERSASGMVQPLGSSVPGDPSDVLPLRVSFGGRDCYALYCTLTHTLTLHLLGASNATVVYKVLDDDTMAVTITDVPGGGGGAVVETGYMFRQR